jgi:hypothetical protein
MIEAIFQRAKLQLEYEKNLLYSVLKEEENTEIGIFIRRVLSWYEDKEKKQLLWETFHEVFDLNPLLFFGTFHSFVVNCLLDDSAFRVEHRKPLTEGYSLIWNADGSFKTTLSDENDFRATPVVVRDNDGSQNVELLMKAMDKAELRDVQRKEKY